jgi:hypothetical protein
MRIPGAGTFDLKTGVIEMDSRRLTPFLRYPSLSEPISSATQSEARLEEPIHRLIRDQLRFVINKV